MRLPLILALPILALAACDGDRSSRATADANAGTASATSASAADDNGQEVAIDTPLFQGKLKLPTMTVNADSFDLNGVHLPPGSAIHGMNMSSSDTNGNKKAEVRVRFSSPQEPAATRDWFARRLPGAGFDVHPTNDGLAGTTDEHKPFALRLQPADGGRTRGEIRIGA